MDLRLQLGWRGFHECSQHRSCLVFQDGMVYGLNDKPLVVPLISHSGAIATSGGISGAVCCSEWLDHTIISDIRCNATMDLKCMQTALIPYEPFCSFLCICKYRGFGGALTFLLLRCGWGGQWHSRFCALFCTLLSCFKWSCSTLQITSHTLLLGRF